jgi:hypothetical protein
MADEFDYDDPDFKEWKKDVEENLVPKLRNSSICVTLAPRGEPDSKFAVELGMMIMLDKPIVIVKEPGQVVPPKLLAVADEVVEVDWNDKEAMVEAQQKIGAAMERLSLPNV